MGRHLVMPGPSHIYVDKQALSKSLKGHCHRDFAVLGQFCAETITLKLYS